VTDARGDSSWGEFDLVDAICRRTDAASDVVAVGPGDDCAVLHLPGGGWAAVTTDTVVGGSHFDPHADPLEAVGFKAYASALSDVAAMGVEATAGVAAVVLPRGTNYDDARRLEAGLRRAAERFAAPLVGGDVTMGDSPLVLTVTAWGQSDGSVAPLLRSSARVGHRVLVTGELGGSLLGRHLEPEPRLAFAAALNRAFTIGAAIDISDGLAGDVGHVMKRSGVGAAIDAARVPVSAAARQAAERSGREALWHALHDGEDFELLFTAAVEEAGRIVADPPLGVPVTDIGEIVEGDELTLRHEDGRTERLNPRAFEHRMGPKEDR
jgi:thiamine-monophosphate kinase